MNSVCYVMLCYVMLGQVIETGLIHTHLLVSYDIPHDVCLVCDHRLELDGELKCTSKYEVRINNDNKLRALFAHTTAVCVFF